MAMKAKIVGEKEYGAVENRENPLCTGLHGTVPEF
jgi:hypothetical protein